MVLKAVTLCKVISGGQTGADQAGLDAARDSGLDRGGFMPYGCITLDGRRPDLVIEHNMEECQRPGYPFRTRLNVLSGCGTICFASNWESPGEKCTQRFIKQYEKPCIKVDIRRPLKVSEVIDWLNEEEIRVLNVAGNSEGTSPGIYQITYDYLMEVFQ